MIIKMRPAIIIAILAVTAAVGISCWRLADWQAGAATWDPPPEVPQITLAPSSEAAEPGSFFPYFRLQREKMRGQQLELLQQIINNPNTDDTSRQSALNRLLTVTNAMEMELKAEGLLKAQGFQDGVIILQDSAASIIISGPQLNEAEEEQVKNRVAGVLKIKTQQISLINRD